MQLVLEVITVPPFGVNTYLLGDADGGEAVVVDPGGRAADIVRVAGQRGVQIQAILTTHAHIDHVAGVAALQELTEAPFWLHAEAEPLLQSVTQQALMFGLPPARVPQADQTFNGGRVIDVGALQLTVRETPGHAPGHVTLVGPEVELDGQRAPFALCGDVIFMGSIGRTGSAGRGLRDAHALHRASYPRPAQ